MESWLELGRLIHVALGAIASIAVLLTAVAVSRAPKAGRTAAGR